jgi:hypothetical protein
MVLDIDLHHSARDLTIKFCFGEMTVIENMKGFLFSGVRSYLFQSEKVADARMIDLCYNALTDLSTDNEAWDLVGADARALTDVRLFAIYIGDVGLLVVSGVTWSLI